MLYMYNSNMRCSKWVISAKDYVPQLGWAGLHVLDGFLFYTNHGYEFMLIKLLSAFQAVNSTSRKSQDRRDPELRSKSEDVRHPIW